MGAEAGDLWNLGEQASLGYAVVLRPRQWTSMHIFKDKVSSARHDGPCLQSQDMGYAENRIKCLRPALATYRIPGKPESHHSPHTCRDLHMTVRTGHTADLLRAEGKHSCGVDSIQERHKNMPESSQSAPLKTQVLSVSCTPKIQSTHLLPRNLQF